MNYTYGESVLKIENLFLEFKKKVILRDINLNIKNIIRETTTGQVISLVGESGIGKTQFLKMLAGLQKPTSGDIKIGIKQENPQAGKIGMVLQTYPLFEHRTVKSNLNLVSKDTEKLNFLAEEFDVLKCIDKYPCQLSGGQRQRVAIIQQILSSEDFILFDEPFSGLDPKATQKLSLAIRKLADLSDNNTVFISSHIFPPALAVSDTVLMLGKQKDKEGATITNYYDLISMDLAWHKDIKKDIRFMQLCNDIEAEFFK